VRWLRQAPCLPALPHLTLRCGQYLGGSLGLCPGHWGGLAPRWASLPSVRL